MTGQADERLYRYIWRNNSERARMCGRVCRALHWMGRNSVLIEFMDRKRPHRSVVSRHALRIAPAGGDE